MNILHCADIHFDNKDNLLKNTIECCDHLVSTAEKDPPDLVVVAGDIYNDAVILGSPATLAAIDFVYKCGNIAPVVVVGGTMTHDAPNSINVFNKLKTRFDIYATNILQQMGLTAAGFISVNADTSDEILQNCFAVISCLPSVNKAGILSMMNLSISDSNVQTVELLRDVLQAWGVLNERANACGIPTILSGHGTVTGSTTSTGQKMVGRDLEFGIGDLKLAKAMLNCLGHIHMRQQLNSNVFYSGSITRENHGETEEKGFYIHTLGNGNLSSRFIMTPARVMKTVAPIEGLPNASLLGDIKEGDYVRISYSVLETETSKVDEAELIRIAKERGACEVKFDKDIIPVSNIRAEGISRLKTLPDKLARWAELNGQEITESLLEKLDLLQTATDQQILNKYFQKEEPGETQLFAA